MAHEKLHPTPSPLRRLRIALGKTQTEMCKYLAMSQANYSRTERGGAASPALAASIAAKLRGKITEVEILYPARYAKVPRKRKSVAKGAAVRDVHPTEGVQK